LLVGEKLERLRGEPKTRRGPTISRQAYQGSLKESTGESSGNKKGNAVQKKRKQTFLPVFRGGVWGNIEKNGRKEKRDIPGDLYPVHSQKSCWGGTIGQRVNGGKLKRDFEKSGGVLVGGGKLKRGKRTLPVKTTYLEKPYGPAKKKRVKKLKREKGRNWKKSGSTLSRSQRPRNLKERASRKKKGWRDSVAGKSWVVQVER